MIANVSSPHSLTLGIDHPWRRASKLALVLSAVLLLFTAGRINAQDSAADEPPIPPPITKPIDIEAAPAPSPGDDAAATATSLGSGQLIQKPSGGIEISGDRLSGIVLPIEPIIEAASFSALRVWNWTVNETQRLVLDGDVKINIGQYAFQSNRAVVWLNRMDSDRGLISQIAIYFPQVENRTSTAGLGVAGNHVLVTASTTGKIQIHTALMTPGKPDMPRLLEMAHERMAEHLWQIVSEPQQLSQVPQVKRKNEAPEFIPTPGGSLPKTPKIEPSTMESLPNRGKSTPWLQAPNGRIRFIAGRAEFEPGSDQNTISIMGTVMIEYHAGSVKDFDKFSTLTLTAQRGVVFLQPGSVKDIMSEEMSNEDILGIYLEGNVVADVDNGDYVIRAPKVYYDFENGQAIMLNAILRTYNRDGRFPLYARAGELRQAADQQWHARQATISTSEFFTPHFAIGSEQVRIDRVPSADAADEEQIFFHSQHNTFRAGGTPIGYWPVFSGSHRRFPLKSIRAGYNKYKGAIIGTRWDFWSLMGMDAPDGIDTTLKLDAYTARGIGGGIDAGYYFGDTSGDLDLYLQSDHGEERTAAGRTLEVEDNLRGLALWQHTSILSDSWLVQAQASYISDETYISSWREEDYYDRREYETSFYAKFQDQNTAFTALADYSINNFISNAWLLASRQYQVDKFPELTYRRYGDNLFDILTYSSEYRASRMRMVFQPGTPEEAGVRNKGFVATKNEDFSDELRNQGLIESWVTQLNTRQELSAPLTLGWLKATPFVSVEASYFLDEYSTKADEEQNLLLSGSIGVRLNTEIQRVYNTVKNELLDLNRMRHILEPYLMLWYASNDFNDAERPQYDASVDQIADGAAAQIGIRNTFQTQRGGPGRWRSVDFLTLDTYAVVTGDDPDQRYPTPQFFSWRPQYSSLGDHLRGKGVWMVTDTMSFSGDVIWDLDNNELARTSVGVSFDHSPKMRTYVEYRMTSFNESELLDIGWEYDLSKRYKVKVFPQWDFRRNDLRRFNMQVTRRFPDFELVIRIAYDQIDGETTASASLDLADF